MKLIDLRTDDGSRHFASLPKAVDWETLREHVALLNGVEIAEILADGRASSHIDFTYRGCQFSITSRGEQFCFFVLDPQCSDVHLHKVGAHCQKLLNISPSAPG